MKRILTIGTTEIDFDRGINVTSTILNKPDFKSGCLWGSTLIRNPNGTVNSSWKNFTAYDYTDGDCKYGVSFTLHRNSKILEITNRDDYVNIMNQYSCRRYNDEDQYCLDFVKISKEYDAFHLTEDAFWSMRLPMDPEWWELKYEGFYSYDAESWIIFNLNAINKGSIFAHNNVIGNMED